MDQTQFLRALDLCYKIGAFVSGKGLILAVKNRAWCSLLSQHHVHVTHAMRRLGCHMARNWDQEQDAATTLAQEIATRCGEAVRSMLALKRNDLHCCIKVMAPSRTGEEGASRVATWVRSKPLDGRPYEDGDDNAHRVQANTVWCCLLGQDDRTTRWEGFNTFSCNDLVNAGDLFHCDRDGWSKYYQSALVFPIRYPRNIHETDFGHVGFLAFDSPSKGAFRGVPDIFKFVKNPTGYKEKLDKSAVFHLGAIFADTLGALLGPAYEINAITNEAQHGQ